MVACGSSGRTVSVYVNDGSGGFVIAWSSVATLPASDLALGDVDGDGDLDIWVARDLASPPTDNALYLNQGSATFVVAALPVDQHRTSALALADIDLDGDLDVLGSASLETENPILYLGDGSGGFALDTSGGIPWSYRYRSRDLALGDVDGDGDPDVVFAHQVQAPEVLLQNRSAQLHWQNLPRTGTELRVQIDGAPGAPWIMVLSLGTGFGTLPGVPGVVRLDLALGDTWAVGAIGGNGSSTYTTRVPPGPWPVGLEIYAQALVGPLTNGRVTNLEFFTPWR